jgi:hypothetical protein
MTQCSFEKLVQYLDDGLDLDKKLELLEHIDECETCRDAIYHISRDRDADFFVYRPYKIEKMIIRS